MITCLKLKLSCSIRLKGTYVRLCVLVRTRATGVAVVVEQHVIGATNDSINLPQHHIFNLKILNGADPLCFVSSRADVLIGVHWVARVRENSVIIASNLEYNSKSVLHCS